MTQTNTQIGFSKARVEALTDGIFAVAMTLLVIELRVPERAGTDISHLPQAIADLFPTFVAWTISFFVLGIFWFSHHRLFHHLRAVDGTLIWLNILHLSFVSLMPFCSALAGRFPQVLFSQVFYSANMILLSTMGLVKSRYVFAHPELWSVPVTLGFYRATRFRTSGLIVVALVAVGIAMVVPKAGNSAFMLMAPISILSGRIQRRAHG